MRCGEEGKLLARVAEVFITLGKRKERRNRTLCAEFLVMQKRTLSIVAASFYSVPLPSG
jgi:hypothetical protein